MRLRTDSATGYRVAAIATLAFAVAGITMLAGILQLNLASARTTPLIGVDPIPAPSWPQQWLGAMRSAQTLQNAAVVEWLNVVLATLLTILILAAVSALIALFAHATARRYEVALRAVVGATRRRITVEHLRKGVANAAIALVIGVPIGLSAAVVANRSWPADSLGVHPVAWLFVSVCFAAGIAAFVARAAAGRMSKAGWLGDVLAPEARTNPGYGAEDLRGLLLNLQFAFTFALLAAALLVWQHAESVQPAGVSSDRSQYVTRVMLDEHTMPEQRRGIIGALQQAGMPAASPGALIGVGHSDQVVSNCGRCSVANMMLPMFPVRTQQHVVGTGFFEAAGFPLRYGREFDASDATARHVVVNDTFADLAFQGQHAIGKTIQVGGLRGEWYTVIGVVRDIPIAGLVSFEPDDNSLVTSRIPGHEPAIYFQAEHSPPAVFDVVGDEPVTLQIAGLTIGAVTTMREVQAAARAPAVWFAGVLSALGGTAAIIAVLSLGALTLLNVRQRELEIAARRSVGARRRDIARMVLANSAITAARGTFFGVVLSLAIARAIQMVLPQMRIFDPLVIAVTATLLLLASVIAAIIPARAAVRIMPAQIHA